MAVISWIRRVCVVAMAVVIAGCSHESSSPINEVRPVSLYRLSDDRSSETIRFPATIQARVTSDLGFRVGGKVISREVDVGAVVKAGQVLAKLDPTDYLQTVQAAQAQVIASQASYEQAKADLSRYQALEQKGFVSAAALENYRVRMDAALAQWRQAQAQLSLQQNQSQYTSLVAPKNGVITAVQAQVGQVMGVGQTAMSLAEESTQEAYFMIPEHRLQALKVGMSAMVDFWSGRPPLKGQIREISPQADPLSRAFAVRVKLDDPPSDLPLGVTATVSFELPHATYTRLVPLNAVFHKDNQSFLWVLNADTMTVNLHPVSLASIQDEMAVLTDALPVGTEVVDAGVHFLTEGQVVRRLPSIADKS